MVLLFEKRGDFRLEFSVSRDSASQTPREVTCLGAEPGRIKDGCANQTVIHEVKHLEFRLEFLNELPLRTCAENRKTTVRVCYWEVNQEPTRHGVAQRLLDAQDLGAIPVENSSFR